MSIKSLALFSRPNSPQAWGVLNEVMSWAARKGLRVLTPPDQGGWTGSGWEPQYCARVRVEADVAISIGGDGTFLGVARSLFGWDKPLLGVNLGHLGFLTDIGAKDIEKMLDALIAGAYTVENRVLLEAALPGERSTGLAFNDVVLSKADNVGRMIEYEVLVDGNFMYALRADGLIITTPTGSTAYALSANGPIMHPSLAAIALVPLSPHSLTARPIVLPSNVKVEVVVRGEVPCRLFCDGQPFGDTLTQDTRVVVTQGETFVKLLHLNDYSVFDTLQDKLGWSRPRER